MSEWKEKCPTCHRQMPKQKIWTTEEFKKTFAPGDKISGWPSGKWVTIMAIGEVRFFYRDHDGSEGVAKIAASTGWRKPK